MRKNLLYLFLLTEFVLSLESCTQSTDASKTTLPANLYEVVLDSSIQTYIEQYTQQTHVPQTGALITVSWTGVYGGQCVYLSKAIVHPKVSKHYPNFWASHRGYLVFVYDSKYKNQLAQPALLQREVDQAITRHPLTLQHREDFIFEPVSWRVTEYERRVQIDTTNVYAKLRDYP